MWGCISRGRLLVYSGAGKENQFVEPSFLLYFDDNVW